MMGLAAQAVGDGLCETALVWYPMVNLSGRYGHNNPQNVSEEAHGNSAFSLPWGYQSGAMFNNLVVFLQYCQRYGKTHDGLAPLCLNLRRNGLKTPWGFYALHEPYQLTIEDYLNGRVIEEPLIIYDCDRPVNTCAAFIFTTAERARDLRQKPVYVLNHAQQNSRGRSSMATLDEHQEAVASMARKMWEGSGLGPGDVDIFNPYDGYLTFTQQFLGGLPVARRRMGRGPRLLRRRHQGRRSAPVPLQRRKQRHRTQPRRPLRRQHPAAQRDSRSPPGDGEGRDRPRRLQHPRQQRLHHVQQVPELGERVGGVEPS